MVETKWLEPMRIRKRVDEEDDAEADEEKDEESVRKSIENRNSRDEGASGKRMMRGR